MNYLLNQFNGINENYMQLLTIPSGTVCNRYQQNDYLYYSPSFNSNKTYFLHCWIIDDVFLQKIKISLCKVSGSSVGANKQPVKILEYLAAPSKRWKEVLIIFKPIMNDFNGIIFELTNRSSNSQHTTIIFEELSELGNAINDFSNSNITIYKLGIRSMPCTIFNVNGEYINIGKSGVMEFNEEGTKVTSICPVIPAAEDTNILNTTKASLISMSDASCISTCLFNYAKTRAGIDFTLDYIYVGN